VRLLADENIPGDVVAALRLAGHDVAWIRVVVLFRLSMPAPTDVGRVIAEIVNGRSDWAGHFSVVGADRIRMRPLPTA